MYVLGLDIGTTKIAGVLLPSAGGTPIKVVSQNNSAELPGAHSWERIQDPERIVQIAKQMVADLKQAATGPIQGIGISGQMHGFLYVNLQGRAISPLYTWQDSRAAVALDAQGSTAQSLIMQKTGRVIFPGYALASHYYNWLKGLQPQEPYKLVSIGAYLGMQLCSNKQACEACADPSEAASFGLYDIEAQSFFLSDIVRLWGEASFLPRQVPFYHQSGRDADGIAVFQALGDNQASFYGAMRGAGQTQNKGQLLINLGTGGQVSFLLESAKLTETSAERSQAETAQEKMAQEKMAQAEHSLSGPQLKDLPHLEPRPYPPKLNSGLNSGPHLAFDTLLVGTTLAGGKAFDLLADFFADVLAFFGAPLDKNTIYARIDAHTWAESQSASMFKATTVKVEPYFYGTRLNPELRGGISHISPSNLKVESLIFGFAEAIVQELRHLIGNRSIPEQIVGSGNGIRRNGLIRQMIEEIFGAELKISAIAEEAACGAAWYANQSFSITRV